MDRERLNREQLEAVTTTEGFVRVIAGAGSGKTRALSERFAYLVNDIGIPPSNILCVTFTNKSANEMRARIRRLTGDNDTGYISTFHGFCVSVLQEDANAVSYPKSFLVLDNGDIDAMLAIIYEERGLTLRDRTFGAARDMIEMQKCIRKPDYYLDLIGMSLDALREKYLAAVDTDDVIFYGYLYQQKKCFGLDYNDLIKFTLHIFSENHAIRDKWQERISYVMIDEFQDIDELQYRLMQALVGYHRNLFIVGDPDQTIYTWRGANVKYLLDFDSAFPGTRTILMMQNYRSTPEILAAVNSLIDRNRQRMKKELLATRPHGASVIYHHAKTSEDEARWIASEIRALLDAGTSAGDIAILYRAHYVSRAIEEVFLDEKLPYTLTSGTPFFSRAEIKDALSYLRMTVLNDDLSFRRVANNPKRNIGEKRMRFLEAYASEHGISLYDALKQTLSDDIFKNTRAKRFVDLIDRYAAVAHDMPISELLSALLDESGYEEALRTEGSQERLDNLAELKQAVYEYETTCGEERSIENYLAHVALFTNADTGDKKGAVRMMTVHTAKGLEFPVVFLASLSEGSFPSKKTTTLEGMEEERRLCFVAMTRAKDRLYLSDAEGRNFDGSFRYPSRFLFDIDKNRITYTDELDPRMVQEATVHIRESENRLHANAQGAVLKAGDRVRHDIMGDGTVLSVDETVRAYVVKFDELDTPRRIGYRARLLRLD